jgi:hypothetical protein
MLVLIYVVVAFQWIDGDQMFAKVPRATRTRLCLPPPHLHEYVDLDQTRAYVCMYVCMYISVYVRVCMYVCIQYVCKHVYIYACMYVCMYVTCSNVVDCTYLTSKALGWCIINCL